MYLKMKTGFKDIDTKILGFMPGSLVVLTGYNVNGKSKLINQMCIAQSLVQGYKVFAYSPELTNTCFKRWLSNLADYIFAISRIKQEEKIKIKLRVL